MRRPHMRTPTRMCNVLRLPLLLHCVRPKQPPAMLSGESRDLRLPQQRPLQPTALCARLGARSAAAGDNRASPRYAGCRSWTLWRRNRHLRAGGPRLLGLWWGNLGVVASIAPRRKRLLRGRKRLRRSGRAMTLPCGTLSVGSPLASVAAPLAQPNPGFPNSRDKGQPLIGYAR